MATSRQTFVVQVHEDGGTVLENVRTRECVWLGQLAEIAVHISGWLDEPRRHGVAEPAGKHPAQGGRIDVS